MEVLPKDSFWTSGQGLARLHVLAGMRYLGDLPFFQLHPALWTWPRASYLRDHVDEALPFAYSRPRLWGPLPAN